MSLEEGTACGRQASSATPHPFPGLTCSQRSWDFESFLAEPSSRGL